MVNFYKMQKGNVITFDKIIQKLLHYISFGIKYIFTLQPVVVIHNNFFSISYFHGHAGVFECR